MLASRWVRSPVAVLAVAVLACVGVVGRIHLRMGPLHAFVGYFELRK